jgi:TRAP-type C4-dicarboxylate transport system permease small subunit
MLKKFLSKILKWQERAENFALVVSALTITCMLILTVADVGGRFLFSSPLLGVYELLVILVPGLGFYSLAYLQRFQEQISVKFVIERLPLNLQNKLDKLTMGISLFTMGFLLVAGASTAIKTWELGETTMGIVNYPLGPAMIVIPISVCLFCLRVIFQLMNPPKNGSGKDPKSLH